MLSRPSRSRARGLFRRAVVCLAFVGALGAMPIGAYAERSASLPPSSAIPTPAALQVPEDEVLLFRAFASGTQMYDCHAGNGSGVWVLRQPHATLTDEQGEPLGIQGSSPG